MEKCYFPIVVLPGGFLHYRDLYMLVIFSRFLHTNIATWRGARVTGASCSTHRDARGRGLREELVSRRCNCCRCPTTFVRSKRSGIEWCHFRLLPSSNNTADQLVRPLLAESCFNCRCHDSRRCAGTTRGIV